MAARWFLFTSLAAVVCAVFDIPAPTSSQQGELEKRPDELRGREGDPLVDWLAGLKIHLDALEVASGGLTLTARNLTCEQLSVERVQSTFTPEAAGGDPQRPGVATVISGIGLQCETEYTVSTAWGLVKSSGTLRVSVKPPTSSARLTFALPLGGRVAPVQVAIDECDTDLDISLAFSGSILQNIINMFSGLIASQIKRQLNSDGCQKVRQLAATNMTDALNQLNCLLLPKEEWVALGLLCEFTASQRHPVEPLSIEDPIIQTTPVRALREVPLPSADVQPVVGGAEEAGPVDLRKVPAIQWASWALKDVVGVQGLRRAVRWATHGTGNATVAGGADPIVTQRIAQGTTLLDVSVYLADVGVHGLDGLNSLQPLRASSATEVDIDLGFGTKERLGFGAWARVMLRLSASDSKGLAPPSAVESNYTFHVGLEKPSISATMKLMVDSAKMKTQRLLSQMYFDAANCTKDYLMTAPQAQRLNVAFAGVSEKLEFAAETVGALEVDLANFINCNVDLFNAVYLNYLPSGISRALSSRRGLRFLNRQFSTALAPTKCMDKEVAKQKANQLGKIEDWRPLLDGQIRKAIDAITDGFLAHNYTDVRRGMRELPALNLSTSTGTLLTLSAQRLQFEGLDKFRALRLLLPDEADPKSLKNRVAIDCPTDAEPWRPTVALDAKIVARGVSVPGTVQAIAPCGRMEVDVDAVLDLPAMLALPAPFPLPCAFRAFSTLRLKNLSSAWTESADVAVGSGSPVEELCASFPSLCSWASGLLGDVVWEDLFDSLRSKALDRCSEVLGDDASLSVKQQGSSEPWYLKNDMSLWMGMLIATAALATLGAAATTRLSPGSMCTEWYMDGLSGRKPKAYAHAVVAVLSSVLCFAFVLRFLATFMLPVAATHAHFDVGPFGTDVESLELITFTLPSMVTHFIEAKAYLSALLLAGGQLVAFCVFSTLFCVWFTPFFRENRRLLVRVTVWMNRIVFVDVVFFAHIIPVLNRDLTFPLDITTRLRTVAGSAMYFGGISNLLTIVCCFELLRLQSLSPILAREVATKVAEARARQPSRIKTMGMAARAICGLLVCVGLVMWLCCTLLTAEFTGLAGMLIPTADFRGVDLFRLTCIGGPFLGACLFLTAILAPAIQALMPFALRLQGRQHSDHLALKFLRELGDAFAIPDVVLSGYVAFMLNADNVARWIGHNKFPVLADSIEHIGGVQAIGLNPAVWWLGFVAMLLGLIGSFGLFFSNAKADVIFASVARSLEKPEEAQP